MAAASVTRELALRGGAAARSGWQASRPGRPARFRRSRTGRRGRPGCGRDLSRRRRLHRGGRRKRRVRDLDDPRGAQPGEVAQRLLRDLGRLLAPLLYARAHDHSTSHEIPDTRVATACSRHLESRPDDHEAPARHPASRRRRNPRPLLPVRRSGVGPARAPQLLGAGAREPGRGAAVDARPAPGVRPRLPVRLPRGRHRRGQEHGEVPVPLSQLARRLQRVQAGEARGRAGLLARVPRPPRRGHGRAQLLRAVQDGRVVPQDEHAPRLLGAALRPAHGPRRCRSSRGRSRPAPCASTTRSSIARSPARR